MRFLRTIKSIFGCRKGIVFDQVTLDEFSRLEGKFPTYIKIENELIKIGGGGRDGYGFKERVLKAAGWTEGSDYPFNRNDVKAVSVFNKIRDVLAMTSNQNEILDRLQRS